MTRAAICGGAELEAACDVLGLEPSAKPRVVLVDLREPGAAARAARYPTEIPRIAIATAAQAELIAALGAGAPVAPTADPAIIGPLLARTIPSEPRDRTRIITVTAARGGTGRTLCAANLARRLCAAVSVIAVDATGTGALGWWLGAEARPWSDLEVLAGELRGEHLELVATALGPRLSLLGGPPAAPSGDTLTATIGAAREIADVVLIDAPLLADERARLATTRSDRVLVLAYADGASAAALSAAELPAGAWILGSQGALDGAFRVLPRDEAAVAAALARHDPIGASLGRAYDDLAELLAIDAS